MDNKLIITQYTDPMCIWCYGLEPSMRKIDFLNPDKVELQSGKLVLSEDGLQALKAQADEFLAF